jgi:hypothetical protein
MIHVSTRLGEAPNKRMRLTLGDGYVSALRGAHEDVPETADYVMYWWDQAARLVKEGGLQRFGFITTNSITQPFNRGVTLKHLRSGSLALAFAVPDHPWVNTRDGAAVRVAMTVVANVSAPGRLAQVVSEKAGSFGDLQIQERNGWIHADLTLGADLGSTKVLMANQGLCFKGVIPLGLGFRVDRQEIESMGLCVDRLPVIVRRYQNGSDIAGSRSERMIIDFFGLSELDAKDSYPSLFQHVLLRVRPERQSSARASYRDKWWIFAEPRPAMRQALAGIDRYIATVETAKHRFFVFLDADLLPDQKLRVVAHDDSLVLAVLSSRIHIVWANATGSWLGVGNDPVYSNSSSFLPFPFPVCSEGHEQRIRALGEALDSHRKCRQELHPKLTMTAIYNVLEKLRSGEPLGEKERVIHEQGLVSLLKQIHDDLDAAVFDAYGWPATLADEEILERLVALNHERHEEEQRGIVRWLRPEFQNPQGTKAETQVSLAEAGLGMAEPAKGKAKRAIKPAWPKELPARVVAVRDLLAETGGATAAEFPRRFKGVKAAEAEKLLESLAAVGVAIETSAGPASERSWRLLR